MWASNLELVRHIFDECEFIITHTQGKTENQVLDDKVLLKALERSIEIIGEATKKLTDQFKNQHSSIEWKKIAGTRDKLIHDYYGIDYDIVWDILTTKIKELHLYLLDQVK